MNFKGDYSQTRASDSKYFSAVNFFCEYTRVMFDIAITTKKVQFHHGFL